MKSQLPNPDILYIITQGNWGGAQRYVYDLASLTKVKNSVLIGVGELKGSSELNQKSIDSGIPTHQFKHLVRRISPWHDIAAVFELKRIYQTLKPEIVHLNSSKAGIIGTFAGLLISKKERPKLVYTAHGWVFNEPLAWPIKKLYFHLEKWTARYKDAIIVTSPEEAKIAIEILHIPEYKVSYIPLGMTAPLFLEREAARAKVAALVQEKSQSLSTNKPWYVTIANAYPTKGLDTLLEAIQNAKTTAEYFIIGQGPELPKLLHQVETTKLTNVHFLGAITNAAELLCAFDGFILTSRKEGLPYVILEALSAQLPIVATRVGGIPSLSQNNPPITLVNPDNSQELATVLKNFPTKKESTAVPTLSQMAEKTNSLYQALTKKN